MSAKEIIDNPVIDEVESLLSIIDQRQAENRGAEPRHPSEADQDESDSESPKTARGDDSSDLT